MEVTYSHCAGLDVHKASVVACVLTPQGQEVRTYKTLTRDLLELADWLGAEGVTHVAMESTGVYWQPVYNLLEGAIPEVWVVNAQHVKNVPGRKTDVKDAAWLADLLRHGLVRPSFIPDRPHRELRELVRYRRGLIEQHAQLANRVGKLLEGANIKLSSVASDLLGASGRAMLAALATGTDDPDVLAALAKGRLRDKHAELVEALRGQVGPHQRFVLQSQLRLLGSLEDEITTVSAEVAARLGPFEETVARLDEIPGVGRATAETILAEIGPTLERFPSAAHLASWARVCPGNNRSAGKQRSGHTGHANRWLRPALIEAARAAARAKGTYLAALYHRIAARRGAKRAAVAVAHALLVIVYHLLTRGCSYAELGGTYLDDRSQEATARRLTKRLERLGYTVQKVTAA